MNKYIITAREIERMLNLAAMEEAGCLSRAGKEELNELVARVQEVIDELAAWWKEIKRNKEAAKSDKEDSKSEESEESEARRFDYLLQECAATFWMCPSVDDEGKSVRMVLVVKKEQVDQMRRLGFTMNGSMIPVRCYEFYSKMMSAMWKRGFHPRRMAHNGGICGCQDPSIFWELMNDESWKGFKKVQESRNDCEGPFYTVWVQWVCKLNREYAASEDATTKFFNSSKSSMISDWGRAVRQSQELPTRPQDLVKKVKVDDPRLTPIVRELAYKVGGIKPGRWDIEFDKVCNSLSEDDKWLEAVGVSNDDLPAIRAAVRNGISELRATSPKFNELIWSNLFIHGMKEENVSRDYDKSRDSINERQLSIEQGNDDDVELGNDDDVELGNDDDSGDECDEGLGQSDFFEGDASDEQELGTLIRELMRETYVTALLKRAGKKDSRKRAFVAAVEAVMGAGEESRQEALLLWDQAKADKERKKELEAYWKKWEQEVEKEKELRKAKRARRGSRAKRAARA
ncbi:hypothetical protein O3669_08285 [Pauljensenia sp. 20925_1_34]|jgi:hypothetical protein|uniref:hypothetical protein n=1 Tax=Pauljensenia sp. 20925_1_34 TaxID=3003674 RepID=UPI00352CBEFB